ncbi:MAG: RagB/SusD family nutrient uptake outer membrane protein, partial [Bacteroides sp.]|nr:RagB/SusD family nutrient uptake outer membrane protein [Bacteroides sp.]
MKKIILYIALFGVGFTSCNDFLYQEPKLSQSNEITLANYSNLNDAMAGAYTYMQSYTWYGGSFFLSSELRCGNAKNPLNQPGSGRYRVDHLCTNKSNYTSSIWNYAYYMIAASNNVINSLEGAESEEVDVQDINNLHAEGLFLRALGHFDLVTTYAQPYSYAPESLGVPIILVTENGKPARNTVKEVYDQIVKDLLEAEKLMSDSYARQGTADAAAAVTKPAIQALLSRVYLYMNKYQESADYATKVINSGKFNLADRSTYLSMWTQDAASAGGEIIFEVYGSNKNSLWDGSGWEGISYITTADPDEGSGDVCATRDLVNLYESSDVRSELFLEYLDEFYTLKYAGKEGSSVPRESNIVILRLSEMYLNRAEALYRGASISGATAESDLAAITDIRGASRVSPSTANIFNERRKELAFEGHIFYDYARTQTSLERTDYDGLAAYKDVPFPSYKWALPIPLREINANENMKQN